MNKNTDNTKNKNNLEILVDSTDYNTAQSLFTDKFYQNLKILLKKEGILSFNCISISWEKKDVKEVIEDLSEYYRYVRLYQLLCIAILTGGKISVEIHRRNPLVLSYLRSIHHILGVVWNPLFSACRKQRCSVDLH